jgi:hypothetical protein
MLHPTVHAFVKGPVMARGICDLRINQIFPQENDDEVNFLRASGLRLRQDSLA